MPPSSERSDDDSWSKEGTCSLQRSAQRGPAWLAEADAGGAVSVEVLPWEPSGPVLGKGIATGEEIELKSSGGSIAVGKENTEKSFPGSIAVGKETTNVRWRE